MRWNHASITDRVRMVHVDVDATRIMNMMKKKIEMANYTTLSPSFYAVCDKYPKLNIINIFK